MEKEFFKVDWRDRSVHFLIGVWLLILIIGVAIRIQFFIDFPFAFGHPDSSQYLTPVVNMLEGGPFIPDEIRVIGTYAFFSFGILKYLGSQSFSIILVQTILAVIAATVGSIVVYKHSNSIFLADFALFLLLVLPRGFFYEHIMLVESLYGSLIIFFAAGTFFFYETKKYQTIGIFCLGLLAALLVLARGQATVTVLVGLVLILGLWLQKKITFKKGIVCITFFLLPIIILLGLYRHSNVTHNNFNGLSAAGNYNLLWLNTSRYLDFESPAHQEIKQFLLPFVIRSNEEYTGDESWGAAIPSNGSLYPGFDQYKNNWEDLNRVSGELAHEAIRTHPLAFLYRFYWNIHDFLWNKTSLFKTTDISLLLFRGDEQHYIVDSIKVWNNQISDPIFHYTQEKFGLGLIQKSLNIRNYSQLPYFELRTDEIIRRIDSLSNFRLMSFGLWFLFVICLCTKKKQLFLWNIFVLVLGQILLTLVVANALYDRYFVGVEPLIVIGFYCALGVFIQFSTFDKVKSLFLLFILPGFVLALFFLFQGLPLPYPIIDKPIPGLSEAIIIEHQRIVVSVSLALLFASVSLFLGMKLIPLLKRHHD